MNVSFFMRQFNERGTSVATYDYAKYNEELLGNKSYIICFTPLKNSNRTCGLPNEYESMDVDSNIRGSKEKGSNKGSLSVENNSYNRFVCRFEMIEIADITDMKWVIEKYDLDFFYTLASGELDDIYQFGCSELWGKCKTIKHCVFNTEYPESDFHISISNALNEKYHTNLVVIPHIVSLPECDEDLRDELDIPKDVIVLGRYGGKDEFNIPDTKQAIEDFLYHDPSVYFLFMNTFPFYDHPNIIYLKGSLDPIYKVKFINTCDAMIHGREMGETFGLSIAEFSSKNKPVITCPCGDLEHIRILGDRAILYHNKDDLFDIFCHIRERIGVRTDWNAYSMFTPYKVMKLFQNFIFGC